MNILKKLLLCLAFAFLPLFADELMDISRELDFFEYSFVNAAGEPITSENHQEVERRLLDFHSRLIKLHNKLRQQRVPRVPNFLMPSMALKRVFDNFGIFNKKKGRIPKLKRTGMGEYTRVFLRNLRQQARRRNQPRPRSATLRNVDIASYCAWLDEIAQSNIELIRKRQYIKPATRRSLETYILNIVTLRKCVVMLAQNKHYKP